MARKISKKEIIKKIDVGFRKAVDNCQKTFKSKGRGIKERLENSCVKGAFVTSIAIQDEFKV